VPDYYFDTSALMKRYVAEVGSVWLTSLVSTPGNVALTSELTPVELVAAVSRRSKGGGSINAADGVKACQAIKGDALTVFTLTKVTQQ
jgi:hypothetical protein